MSGYRGTEEEDDDLPPFPETTSDIRRSHHASAAAGAGRSRGQSRQINATGDERSHPQFSSSSLNGNSSSSSSSSNRNHDASLLADENDDDGLYENDTLLSPSPYRPLAATTRSGNSPALRDQAAATTYEGIPPVPLWEEMDLPQIYDELVQKKWKKRLANGTNKIKRTGDVLNCLLNVLAEKGYIDLKDVLSDFKDTEEK